MPILTVIGGAPCSMAAIMPIRMPSIFSCRSALRKAPSGRIEGSSPLNPGGACFFSLLSPHPSPLRRSRSGGGDELQQVGHLLGPQPGFQSFGHRGLALALDARQVGAKHHPLNPIGLTDAYTAPGFICHTTRPVPPPFRL